MDTETPLPSTDLVKCCNCGCSCSLINGYSEDWFRSVKRKFNEFEDSNKLVIPGFDYSSVARVQIENECDALRETVGSQQQSIQDLYEELEEERNASSSAANEAMSMILRLQREKAEIQMEARQFKRFAEEKMAHDQQELLALEDLLYKREQIIQSLTCEVQAYKHRMMSYGFTEDEADGEKGGRNHNQIMVDEGQFDFPMYDYPPLKCNMNETHGPSEMDNDDVEDVEKYAFGETPREELKNLEFRISQMERNPSSNQIDGDFPAAKNILEKVIVGHSPRRARHSRRFSTDSSNSLLGFPRESRPDFASESPRPGSSFKKMEYVSQMEDYSNLKKLDNGSEIGDDMSDRVYTIDSIHNGVPYNDVTEPKASVGICEDYMTTPRESLNLADIGDPEIKKLYTRLHALEADRESMKQAIISMRTDKAQLVLLKEIAQQLCKEMSPVRPVPVKKPSLFGTFSLMSIFKWTVSFVFWRNKTRRNKYMFGLSANNVGLLMLLDKGPRVRHWRCLTSTQGLSLFSLCLHCRASAWFSSATATVPLRTLNLKLVEACDSLGWKTPSKIQYEAIPHALEGKDLIGLAQTGSGKTGAFALPILQALLDSPQAFFACVLSPTRELAIQIGEQFDALGSTIGVKCAVVVGGISMMQQAIALAKRPHIVVGTPGRLMDHLSNTKGFSLRTLKFLVLDEADRLLNEEFEKSIDEILSVIPRKRRTYLFSATMTKKVRKLQRACLRNPVKIEAASKYSTVDTLKQQFLLVPPIHKDCYLVYILTEMSGSTSMVFTRTCDSTRLLALMLRNLGLRAVPISGQMSQSKRIGALNLFKAGACNILICTDVASRGLDIPSVDMVINYNIPTNSKDYIHRVGRTARAGRSGVAISLVNQYDVEWFMQIEELIGKKLPEYPVQKEEVEVLKDRVSEANRISIRTIKETGGKKRRGGEDDDGKDMDRCLGNKNGKKMKRR